MGLIRYLFIGGAKAAAELGILENTMYGWTKAVREGRLDIGSSSHTTHGHESGGGTGSPAHTGQEQEKENRPVTRHLPCKCLLVKGFTDSLDFAVYENWIAG